MHEIFGEVISRYTRQQAIEDGLLVDLSQPDTAPLIQEAGFTIPVAMTAAAFGLAVWPIENETADQWLTEHCQDFTGRLWDTLAMLRHAIKKQGNTDVIEYRLTVLDHTARRRRVIALKAVCGPDDHGEPCITIMLPTED